MAAALLVLIPLIGAIAVVAAPPKNAKWIALGATIISMEAYNKISDADRKQIDKITQKIGAKIRKTVRKDNVSAQNQMTRKGVTVVNTPVAMVDEFRKNAEQVWKELAGKVYTQAELDMVLQARAEFRAKNKK